MEKLLLKPFEVMEVLRIGRSQVYEMIARGELPSIRIGRSIRVPTAALKQWVDEKQATKEA